MSEQVPEHFLTFMLGCYIMCRTQQTWCQSKCYNCASLRMSGSFSLDGLQYLCPAFFQVAPFGWASLQVYFLHVEHHWKHHPQDRAIVSVGRDYFKGAIVPCCSTRPRQLKLKAEGYSSMANSSQTFCPGACSETWHRHNFGMCYGSLCNFRELEGCM